MKTLILLALVSQFPSAPEKTLPTPAAPSKSPALASPQVQASPQQSFAPAPQYDQPAVVLQAAPRVYAVNRVVLAAPVAYAPATCAVGVQADPVGYAMADFGCGVAQQQVVVQRSFVQRAPVVRRQVVVQHAAVARAPRKVVTKSRTVTKTRRGLFGRG